MYNLKVSKTPDPHNNGSLTMSNSVYVNPTQFADVSVSNTSGLCYVSIENYIFIAEAHMDVQLGTIALNQLQRGHVRKSINMVVGVSMCHTTYPMASKLLLNISVLNKAVYCGEEIDATELCAFIKSQYTNQVFVKNQKFAMEFEGRKFLIAVSDFNAPEDTRFVQISADTQFDVYPNKDIAFINLPLSNQTNSLFQSSISFGELGIGGLDEELTSIFRRAFATRIYPPSQVKKFGVKHVKGLILFGPPGTGKTLIARKLGQILNTVEPKVVNGPEILNKMVGGSEENIRRLFEPAKLDQEEKGDNSPLHLIIFDELDAICKQRGTNRDSTGVHDSVVNQLLSMMDGVNSLNNVLIIGMTNRLDMLDRALLRPGRFEIHMEIGLPDEIGRQSILSIHTNEIRKNDLLSEDVDLAQLATVTKNFSGAELEGLVKCAVSHCLSEPIQDLKNLSSTAKHDDHLKVSKEHFELALREVKPMFGGDTCSDVFLNEDTELIHHSTQFEQFIGNCYNIITQFKQARGLNIFNLLVHGDDGEGKSSVAKHLAIQCQFPFMKIISADSFIGQSEFAVADHITQTFMDAHKSNFSVIVLDDLEQLIQYVPLVNRFSSIVLSTILSCLKKRPSRERKLLVVATTNMKKLLKKLNIHNCFHSALRLPVLTTGGVKKILDFNNCHGVDVGKLPACINIKQLVTCIKMGGDLINSLNNCQISGSDE
jgi:vesicle-fusing ATPase